LFIVGFFVEALPESGEISDNLDAYGHHCYYSGKARNCRYYSLHYGISHFSTTSSLFIIVSYHRGSSGSTMVRNSFWNLLMNSVVTSVSRRSHRYAYASILARLVWLVSCSLI